MTKPIECSSCEGTGVYQSKALCDVCKGSGKKTATDINKQALTDIDFVENLLKTSNRADIKCAPKLERIRQALTQPSAWQEEILRTLERIADGYGMTYADCVNMARGALIRAKPPVDVKGVDDVY